MSHCSSLPPQIPYPLLFLLSSLLLTLPLIQERPLIPGASFRNTGEILELAGCDFLTISPALLDELQKTEGQVPKKLDPNTARDASVKKVSYIYNEPEFRYLPSIDLSSFLYPFFFLPVSFSLPPSPFLSALTPSPFLFLSFCLNSLHHLRFPIIYRILISRFYFNEDQMAVEKLSDGIRKFAADAETLKELLKSKLQSE